jgi:predicted metal-dependent phosphotriesterase family hydrolase
MPHYSRRTFIRNGLTITALSRLPNALASPPESPLIMTVTGAINPSKLGTSLIHEHILVDFIGADKVNALRYDTAEVFQVALPVLNELKAKGCTSLVECTPAYLGRDVRLLKRLSEATGLQIITNTGFYGAVGQKYLPAFVSIESAEKISKRWISEWENGIEGSGIKPGFMKLGVDNIPFTEEIKKIIVAAALTHLKTGLTIGIHTSNGGKPALEEMRLLRENNVSPEAWIWIHAQNEKDLQHHFEVAGKGGWVSFDGIGKDSIEANVASIYRMKEKKLLHRVLISQDAGWYHVGETGGGNYRNYNDLFDLFIPALEKRGFSKDEINMLVSKNPAEAFTIRIKKIN